VGQPLANEDKQTNEKAEKNKQTKGAKHKKDCFLNMGHQLLINTFDLLLQMIF